MSDVLLLVDVMNRYDFPDGTALLGQMKRKAPAIARLKQRFRAAGQPVIYANDNHGQWRSDFATHVEACTRSGAIGATVTRPLVPDDDDYFVLKPHLSAFFGTPLHDLLVDLGATRVVLCGLATDACVLATAIDAHMRRFKVWVPSDCVAAPTAHRSRRALEVMEAGLQASVSASPSFRFAERATSTA
jgi:nicotinamidase-related amidase